MISTDDGFRKDSPATPMAMPSKTEWKQRARISNNASPRFAVAIAALFSGTAGFKS